MLRLSKYYVLCLVMLVATSAGAQSVRLKIATMAPDGSFWVNELRSAADQISERTDGRVSLRLYPGGTMGGDQAVLRKIRIGQLHGGVLLGGGIAGGVDPDFDLYTLPLLFRSYDEVDYVRERMDQVLLNRLAGKGYVAFGLTETGFTYLLSVKATSNRQDLKGRKAWIPQGDPIGLAIVESAGLSPVPLPISDVLTGLQTGLIDTVAAPPVGALALQWFTKAGYFTDLPITYIFGATVISAKAFAKMSAEDQEVVREVMTATEGRLDKRTRSDNRDAREALAKQGVQFLTPTAETLSWWEGIAEKARARLIEDRGFDAGFVAEVEKLLGTYRSQQTPDAVDD